jgi:hypothetical protein
MAKSHECSDQCCDGCCPECPVIPAGGWLHVSAGVSNYCVCEEHKRRWLYVYGSNLGSENQTEEQRKATHAWLEGFREVPWYVEHAEETIRALLHQHAHVSRWAIFSAVFVGDGDGDPDDYYPMQDIANAGLECVVTGGAPKLHPHLKADIQEVSAVLDAMVRSGEVGFDGDRWFELVLSNEEIKARASADRSIRMLACAYSGVIPYDPSDDDELPF